jgi:adenosine deaminase
VADWQSHPLKFYFDVGLRVTVNTDNRLITDTSVTKELLLAHERMGFTLPDLCTVLVQGFKSAFLPFREKQDLLRQVNAEIAEVLARSGGEVFHARPLAPWADTEPVVGPTR